MSLFSVKQPGEAGVQQWASALTVGKAIKDFYASQGDVILTGANTVATLQDGPEKVVRYGNLTLGDGTTATSLTTSSRCKGLTVICDNLTVRNNATLNMTGKGARVMTNDDPFFPFVDFRIPNQITLSSSQITLAQALATIKAQGFAPWDQGTWQHLVSSLYGFNVSVSQAGTLALMLASGCGAGGGGLWASTPTPGNTGAAGNTGGMGGGGGGGINWSAGTCATCKAGRGCPYSGGAGSGGVYYGPWNLMTTYPNPSLYSGPGGKGGVWTGGAIEHSDPAVQLGGYGGGGAGNPGGVGASSGNGSAGSDGCGGKLVIICYGAVNIQGGGKIEANGMPGGGATGYGGGGGSGGGHISIITPSCANSGTVQAAGGLGGDNATSTTKGGAGGAGSVVTKTFTDLGWQ